MERGGRASRTSTRDSKQYVADMPWATKTEDITLPRLGRVPGDLQSEVLLSSDRVPLFGFSVGKG